MGGFKEREGEEKSKKYIGNGSIWDKWWRNKRDKWK
jgi:hypothetical protein